MRPPSTHFHPVSGLLLALGIAATLIACGGDGDGASASTPTMPTTPTTGATVPVGDTVALTGSGKLISFNRTAPSALVGSVAVTGLAPGEALLGIDFRPVDGKLYGVGSLGNLYALDPSTGVATLKAALTPAIGDNRPFTKLDGTRFGIGYNAVSDRLRIVSDTGQNLHVNVGNGATVTDAALTGASVSVAAVAHTNALPGAVSTHLYDIDSSTGTIYLQALNDGTLSTPVPLGVSGAGVGGFSIDARNNTAYAALAIAGSTHLYTVPLSAGSAAVDVGGIGSGEALLGLALTQPLAVHVVALSADGGTLLLFDAAAPNVFTATLPITGLDSGETLLGFDYRPADRQLYGLTSNARIVTLDTTTGAATLVSTLLADPNDDTLPYAGLIGTRFSVDFDPAQDRLRVISDTGASIRVDVATGAVATDTNVGADNGSGQRVVVAAAYGHSYSGATSTSLYDLVTNNEGIAIQTPTEDGTLVDIGGGLPFSLDQGAAIDVAGGDDGLFLVAAPIVPDMPWVLYAPAPNVNELFRGDLYRNPNRDNYTTSFIGGEHGPAIIDIAIQPL